VIPDFQDDGNLPPGVHRCSFDELVERFGCGSEIRRVQAESLGWLLELVRKSGGLRLVVNGSFVTDVLEPNDVDCVILIDEEFPSDTESEAQLVSGLPFLDIQLVTQKPFDQLVDIFFATDRQQRSKGVVEIEL
jgi:hypothetical protein